MKKVLAMIMAIMMIVTMACPVWAAEDDNNGLSTVEVQSIIDSAFPEYSQLHSTASSAANILPASTLDVSQLVYEETRAVSDTMDGYRYIRSCCMTNM